MAYDIADNNCIQFNIAQHSNNGQFNLPYIIFLFTSATCLNMFTVLLIPSIRAMMSSLVKDDEQGKCSNIK